MNITLIGGHGKVALLAAPLLVQDGCTVRSVIRNPDHAEDVAATGAEPVVQDIETLDADGWENLLQDADVVVWSAGAGGGDPRRTMAVDRDAAIASIDAAATAGVGRYVMVSYFGARPDHGVDPEDDFYAYAEAKAAADTHLRAADLEHVILMPSRLTTEEATGSIDTKATTGGEISRANVAAMILAAVRAPGIGGAEITANDGPTPIEEAVAAFRR